MTKIGAAKVHTSMGPIWQHYSESGDTLKCRRYVDGMVIESYYEEPDVEDWKSLAECKEILPDEASYSWKSTEVWAQILRSLNDGDSESKEGNHTPESEQPLIVPVTRLRTYYGCMKVLEKAFFPVIAKMYAAKPSLMESLWNASRKQFSEYNNQTGFGQGDRQELPGFEGALCKVSKTDEFTVYLKKQANGLAGLGFDYVEREINPWRTRGGKFANKKPATKTGHGGMDLLLKSPSGSPVVGEVKIKDDKNCFFALLQAMTYAVELSTDNQFQRLTTTFPGEFEDNCIDIALIMVNPVEKDDTREATKQLICDLNKRSKCQRLGKIMLFESREDNEWDVHPSR